MNPMPEHAKEKFIQMLLKFETPIRCIEQKLKEEKENEQRAKA